MSVRIEVIENGASTNVQQNNVGQPTTPGVNNSGGDVGAMSIKNAKTMGAAAILGKGAASYAVSNVGKYTGSSSTQRKVNNTMEVGGMAMAMYLNPALGVANLALKIATSVMDELYRVKWETIELNQAKARAGYAPDSYDKGR